MLSPSRWASKAPYTSMLTTCQSSGTLQNAAVPSGRSSASTGIVAAVAVVVVLVESVAAGCAGPRLVSHRPPPATSATGASAPSTGGAAPGARSMSSAHEVAPLTGTSPGAAETRSVASTDSIGTASTNVMGAPLSSL